MLTKEDDVEIHALAARGWTKAAIARHTGRDRKTIQKYFARPVGAPGREREPSCLDPFRGYVEARFVDDPHVEATVLYRELAGAGFDRSYPTLVRELRRLELRPVCLVCQHRCGRSGMCGVVAREDRADRAYPPDRLANDVLRSVERNHAIIVSPPPARIAWIANRIAPRLIEGLNARELAWARNQIPTLRA